MFESSDEDDQRGAESSSRMWAEPEPGPSMCESSRQGYCSYCRVLYRDLDQHLSSLQHLDSVRASSRGLGSLVSISQTKHTLLERFLQDVMQHHPHHYNDPRPSHSDLPPVSAPLAPNKEVGDKDGRIPAASDATCQSANQERDDAHTCSQSEERLREGACQERLAGQQELGNTQTPPPLHRKAHRKTDRRKSSVSSSELMLRPPHQVPDPGFGADSGPGPGPGPGRSPLERRPSVSWQKQRQETLKNPGDSVDQTIEQVIQTYCSGLSWTPCQKETANLDFGLPVSPQTPSEDWGAAVQVQQAGGGPDLTQLMDARVDLQDQVYPLQLDLALRGDPRDPPSPPPPPLEEEEEEEEEEEVLPLAEDVPKSFRGKTWTQIRLEDEERVEKLVRQFRDGKFRCYFDSESLARYGRRRRSRGGCGHSGAEPEVDALPLMDQDGDSGSVRRARRRRSFRLASRCQVVKVSQATQTFRLVAPVVHQLLSEPPNAAVPPPTQAAAAAERTPDMLRWRRLPSSYSAVITPLQPRTSLVYLLCSPPAPAGPPGAGPAPKRCRRKRRPLDPNGLLKVKYKRFPVRLYDLSSNQILRNAPKGFVWYQGSAPSIPAPPCVRQLFRSLSTDQNAEGGQRSADATPPFSSRCPLSALSKDVALSDKRSVLRRRGQVSEAPPPPPPSERGRGVTHQATRPPKRRTRAEATPPTLRRGTLRQTGAEPTQHQNQRGRTRRGRSCEKAQR